MANSDDDFLLTDDLMPNADGVLFTDPVTKQAEEQEEAGARRMIVGAEPILTDLFGWINNEIKLSETIMPIDTQSNIEVTTQILAQQKLREKLVVLKVSLRNMADRFEVPYDKEAAD